MPRSMNVCRSGVRQKRHVARASPACASVTFVFTTAVCIMASCRPGEHLRRLRPLAAASEAAWRGGGDVLEPVRRITNLCLNDKAVDLRLSANQCGGISGMAQSGISLIELQCFRRFSNAFTTSFDARRPALHVHDCRAYMAGPPHNPVAARLTVLEHAAHRPAFPPSGWGFYLIVGGRCGRHTNAR